MISGVQAAAAEDSGHYHSSCAVLSLFSTAYRLLGVLYGCGHWTGTLSGGDYALHRNTNDHLLSRRCFLHLHSAYPFLCRSSTIHFSTSFTLFVTRNQLSRPPHGTSIPTPSQCQELHTHTQSNATTKHTHTLWRSVLLSSPHLSWSLFHSLTRPVVFFNGGFCSFHLPSKTKDFCAHRTEERRRTESRPARKRSYPWVWSNEWRKKEKSHFMRENYSSLGVSQYCFGLTNVDTVKE